MPLFIFSSAETCLVALKNLVFRLTPLGRAHLEVEKYVEDADEEDLDAYRRSLSYYRESKLIHMGVRVLLYAGIITSVAATFGLPQIEVLQRAASYIGTTLLLALYGSTGYVKMIRREDYHVKREILLSHAAQNRN